MDIHGGLGKLLSPDGGFFWLQLCGELVQEQFHLGFIVVQVSLQPFLLVLNLLINSPSQFSELGLKPFLSRAAHKSLQARLLDIHGLVGEALERGGDHREEVVRTFFLSNHGVTNH